MKKVLVGCLVVAILGVVLFVVGSVLLYRTAAPYVESAREAVRDIASSTDELPVTNTTAFTPPSSGELTEAQVQRFMRVQQHMRTALGDRMKALEEKYEHLKTARGGADLSVSEAISGVRDLAGVLGQARRHQVDALNAEGFSRREYDWVRRQVLEVLPAEAVNMVDLTAVREAIRDSTGQDIPAPSVPESSVPARNRELVKPHLEQLGQWLPLAAFGF